MFGEAATQHARHSKGNPTRQLGIVQAHADDLSRVVFKNFAVRPHEVAAQSWQGLHRSLGLVLRDRDELAAARPLFERALAIRDRVLGPDNPDTVATRRASAELATEGDGPPVDG